MVEGERRGGGGAAADERVGAVRARDEGRGEVGRAVFGTVSLVDVDWEGGGRENGQGRTRC